MATSSATYAARESDSGAYINTQLLDADGAALDLTTLGYATAVFFVAKHQTDTAAPKIRETGVIDVAGEGRVHVVLDIPGSSPRWRRGIYDAHWEVESTAGSLFWAVPPGACETFEILESLQ